MAMVKSMNNKFIKLLRNKDLGSILTTHRCARIHFKRSVIKGKYKDMEEIYEGLIYNQCDLSSDMQEGWGSKI